MNLATQTIQGCLMSKHDQTPNRSKNLKQKADMPPKSDIGEKLSKIGNLGKKLDKSHATKRTFDTQRLDQSPLQKVRKRKKSSGVSLLGGLQDVGRYRIIWGLWQCAFWYFLLVPIGFKSPMLIIISIKATSSSPPSEPSPPIVAISTTPMMHHLLPMLL